jgi:hypothetical protein
MEATSESILDINLDCKFASDRSIGEADARNHNTAQSCTRSAAQRAEAGCISMSTAR